jgi:hypothetical protein
MSFFGIKSSTNYVPWTQYDESDVESDKDEEERVPAGGSKEGATRAAVKQLTLDPIPYAGSVSLKDIELWFQRLRGMLGECHWMQIALDMVFYENLLLYMFDADELESDVYKTKKTRSEFKANIILLHETYHVISKAQASEIIAWVKYFEVAKKNNAGRAIMDSRMAGKIFHTPPPVNLPMHGDILKMVNECNYFWTADFKHWYYQITIVAKLQKYFGISIGNEIFKVVVLPQGWSWSSFIAQSVAWSIILHTQENQIPLYDLNDIPRYELPRYIPIRDKEDKNVIVGGVYLWYDNIMVCSKFKEYVQQWSTRIVKNANFLKAHFSEFDKDDQGNVEVKRKVEYVGMVITSVKGAPTTWKHTEKRQKKIEKLSVAATYNTPRHIACAVGNILWDNVLSCIPLFNVSEEIDILRIYSQDLINKKSWDKRIIVDKVHIEILSQSLKKMAKNDPKSLPKRVRIIKIIYIATDASTTGMGYVVMGEDMKSSRQERWEFDPPVGPEEIYYYELLIVSYAIRDVCSWYGTRTDVEFDENDDSEYELQS